MGQGARVQMGERTTNRNEGALERDLRQLQKNWRRKKNHACGIRWACSKGNNEIELEEK